MRVKLYFCQHVPQWMMSKPGQVSQRLTRNKKIITGIPTQLGVGYVKSNCESDEDTIEIVTDPRLLGDCDLIGVSATAFGLREAILIANHYQDIPVVLGGYGAHWDGVKDFAFAHIVKGDGEISFRQVMDGTAKERVLSNWVEDLDSLKFPHRQGVQKTINAVSSRGCCYKCKFCTMASTQKLRFHSPEWFADDITQAVKKFPQVERLILDDDLFAISEKRLEKVAKVFEARGLNKRFKVISCNVRGDKVTPNMIKLMKRAGINLGRIGIESASDRMLKIFGKNETIAQQQRAIDLMAEAGMEVWPNLIYHGPGETEEDRRLTDEFRARNKEKYGNRVLFRNIHYTPLPGSALYDGTSPLTYKTYYEDNE